MNPLAFGPAGTQDVFLKAEPKCTTRRSKSTLASVLTG
jgi:hypothetical protein